MNDRGQSALEFILLVGAVLFFFLIFAFAVQSQRAEKATEEREFLVKDVAYQVQEEVALAVRARDGYERVFFLPKNILNKEYSVEIVSNSVFVKTLDGKTAITLPISHVDGEFVPGSNEISKNNGTISVN